MGGGGGAIGGGGIPNPMSLSLTLTCGYVCESELYAHDTKQYWLYDEDGCNNINYSIYNYFLCFNWKRISLESNYILYII